MFRYPDECLACGADVDADGWCANGHHQWRIYLLQTEEMGSVLDTVDSIQNDPDGYTPLWAAMRYVSLLARLGRRVEGPAYMVPVWHEGGSQCSQ